MKSKKTKRTWLCVLAACMIAGFIAACAGQREPDRKVSSVLQQVKSVPTNQSNMRERFQILTKMVPFVAEKHGVPAKELLPRSEAMEIRGMVVSGDSKAAQRIDEVFRKIEEVINKSTPQRHADKAVGGALHNLDFEESSYTKSGQPKGWQTLTDMAPNKADRQAVYEMDDKTFRSGKHSVMIKKSTENKMAGWVQGISKFESGKRYRISAWLKTDKMTPSSMIKCGANLSVVFFIKGLAPLPCTGPAVRETRDWHQQELTFIVPEECSEVKVILGLQYMKGTAWWDEVSVAELPPFDFSGLQEIPEDAIDQYGGLKMIKGDATGFFHTQKIGGRWWIITPEGHGFFVIGIQHMIRRDKGSEKWMQDSIRRLKGLGFNTLSHNRFFKGFAYDAPVSPSVWGFPYVTPELRVHIPGIDPKTDWYNAITFPDVFDNKFRNILDRDFKRVAGRFRDDPWLLGYFLSNELPWGGHPEKGNSLFDAFFALSRERAGKKALVEYLRKRYSGNARAFNEAWGTKIKNFNQLLTMTRLGKGIKSDRCGADRSEFLRLVAETYFKTNHEIIKKYDRNHMTLGVRFRDPKAYSLTPKEVYQTIGKYVDIVSFNLYTPIPRLEVLEESYKYHQKPILITEFSFAAKDSGLPNTRGAALLFNTQKDRALWYERYLSQLLTSPIMVGQIWYKYADDPPRKEGQEGENFNYGLFTAEEKPYEVLVEKVKQVNRRIYPVLLRSAKERN